MDYRTKPIGDFRIDIFKKVDQFDNVIQLIYKFTLANRRRLVLIAIVALVLFLLGYYTACELDWWSYSMSTITIGLVGVFSWFLGLITKPVIKTCEYIITITKKE